MIQSASETLCLFWDIVLRFLTSNFVACPAQSVSLKADLIALVGELGTFMEMWPAHVSG